MNLNVIDGDFSVCKINDIAAVDFTQNFCFVGKTDEELSLVCATEHVPEIAVVRDDGWKAFRIQGTLDFSLIGILSRISSILAENRIGIFAVSTFNTDYILVKEENFARALSVLEAEGYGVIL